MAVVELRSTLEAALLLESLGCSVIPLRERSKSPAIKSWKEFQERRATPDEIRDWFGRHPEWNLGLVCGTISGLAVIDIDGEEGEAWFKTQSIPMPPLWQRTSGAHKCHLIYRHPGGAFQVRPSVDTTVKVDVRGDGSYIAVAPSIHPSGARYTLQTKGNQKLETALSELPLMPSMFVQMPSDSIYGTETSEPTPRVTNRRSVPQNATVAQETDIVEGERNSTLTSMCGTWYGRGSSYREVLTLAHQWNVDYCRPPLSEQEVDTIVRSMANTHGNNNPDAFNAGGLQTWLASNEGIFTVDQLYRDMNIKWASDKAELRHQLIAMVKANIIERIGENAGMYRKIDATLNHIDLDADEGQPLKIWLPFNLHRLTAVYPGNTIVVAGETNSGKTSLLLSIAAMNFAHPIRYLSSEMTPTELRNRLKAFGIAKQEWLAHCEFIQRSDRFADAINPDGINIIDYLEMSDNFFKANQYITEIFKKLRKGIAIIAIQKKRGELFGRGGEFTLEKARLGISLFCHGHTPSGLVGSCLVTKAKNVIGDNNPQDKRVYYRLNRGVEYDCNPIATVPTMRCGLAWYSEKEQRQIQQEIEEFCKASAHAPVEVKDEF